MAMLDRLKNFILGGTDEDEGYETPSDQTPIAPFDPCGGKVVLIKPDLYINVGLLTRYLCAGYLVVADLSGVTPEGARRIVDFLSGAAYSRDGRLIQISCKAYLLAPSNANVHDWDEVKDDEWDYGHAFNF